MALGFSHHSNKRFKFLKGLVIFFILSIIFIAGFYFLLYSNFFKATIEIKGNAISSSELLKNHLIAQMLQKRKWRSIVGAENILFWLGETKPLVVENMPAVKAVNIKVDFFQKKVFIEAKEREIVGTFCDSNSSYCYFFDEEGVLFFEAPQTEGNLILKIIDKNNRHLFLGQKALKNPQWLKNILMVWDIFQKSDVEPISIILDDLNLRQWEIDTFSGPKFYFSLDNLPSNLAQILKGLAGRLEFNTLQYIDFRIPNRVYYK